jgi:DNA-binding CsgD family transcriptional regulator
MILSAISVILFALQVLLLPAQLYSYLELKIDKTRLRFLLLVLSFVCFNSLWVMMEFLFEVSSGVSSIVLTYCGIFLIAHFYNYITKELSLTSKKYSALNLILLLVLTELLRDSSLIVVAREFLPYTKVFFFLVFQIIAVLYGVRIVRLIFLNESANRSPIQNAASSAIVTTMFLPLVIFHVEVTSLYNLMINAIFLVIALAYFRHFVIKLKLEKRIFQRSSDLGNNLQEQFVRVPEIFFEYDLSSREREISIYLLKGMSYEEIADKLFRTSGAIRKQGSQAYAKAGVKNLKEFRKKFEFKNGKISPRHILK